MQTIDCLLWRYVQTLIFSYTPNLMLNLSWFLRLPTYHYQGTWLNSDSGLHNRQLPIPSNVSRLSHAIKTQSGDGISQVVYYQPGLGSLGGIGNRIGGATGDGLSENIRSGYSYIANNYERGDEIFLFGFSRGGNFSFVQTSSLLLLTLLAFTARSIAGLIGGVGLLTKETLPYLAEVVKDFENGWNPTYRPAYPNIPFPKKPSGRDPRYRTELETVWTLPQIKEMFSDLMSAWSFKIRNWYQSHRSLGHSW